MRAFIVYTLLFASVVTVQAEPRAFTVHDLVMMERISDPHVSPDAHYVVYTVRETDLPNNKGVYNLWLLDLSDVNAKPRKITISGATDPRWSSDGKAILFLSRRSGSAQLWRLEL